MKVLNLYSGIGGNRKDWPKHYQITSVELHPGIAKEYRKLYPSDELIEGDSIAYLLENYQQFDFIWASPPCPTHSRARYWAYRDSKPIMPDMTLYQLIIFLKTHFKGNYCVENVIPYYEPLIEPSIKIGRHLFWTNFKVNEYQLPRTKSFNYKTSKDFAAELNIHIDESTKGSRGFDLNKVYRNCVKPEIGVHVLNCSTSKNKNLFSYGVNE